MAKPNRKPKPPHRTVIRTVKVPGGRLAELVYEGDDDSRPVVHGHVLALWEIWERKGLISAEACQAGNRFRHDFDLAALHGVRAAPLVRVGGHGQADLTHSQIDARNRIAEASRLFGAPGNPTESLLWHVVGEGMTIQDWCVRERWQARPPNRLIVAGMLRCALEALAVFYARR